MAAEVQIVFVGAVATRTLQFIQCGLDVVDRSTPAAIDRRLRAEDDLTLVICDPAAVPFTCQPLAEVEGLLDRSWKFGGYATVLHARVPFYRDDERALTH